MNMAKVTGFKISIQDESTGEFKQVMASEANNEHDIKIADLKLRIKEDGKLLGIIDRQDSIAKFHGFADFLYALKHGRTTDKQRDIFREIANGRGPKDRKLTFNDYMDITFEMYSDAVDDIDDSVSFENFKRYICSGRVKQNKHITAKCFDVFERVYMEICSHNYGISNSAITEAHFVTALAELDERDKMLSKYRPFKNFDEFATWCVNNKKSGFGVFKLYENTTKIAAALTINPSSGTPEQVFASYMNDLVWSDTLLPVGVLKGE